MSILITLFVTIVAAVVGAAVICCFIMPMLGIVAVLANGAEGYKLDKIADKYSLYSKKSALSLMTKIMIVMALAASCIAFMYSKFNPNEHFMFVLGILEFILVPAHLVIGAKLKQQLADN